jgi:type IV pilus assembly protein PilB
VVFGFFRKREDEADEDEELEPVSFLGPTNGKEVNLKAHARLVEAGLVTAKDLVTEAIDQRADTLRVEPKGAGAQVTIYIDGMPKSGGKLSKTEGAAVVQVMKLVAALDPKDRKVAHSGAIKAEFDGRKFLLGITSTPVAEGERLVIRIYDQAVKLDLPADLGMGEPMRVKLRELMTEPGVLAVCGPAGSGTTTTLYGVLRNVDSYMYTVFTLIDPEGRKLPHISTYDDPVEGDDLEATLTRLIRREANVILCEPIRTPAVARAIFGKADSATLLAEAPGKDPCQAVYQLVQQVGDPAMVANGLKGVVTQKLLRRLCPDCKLAYRPKAEFVKKLGLDESARTLYRVPPPPDDPKNDSPCEKCDAVGYWGRVAMFELLEMSEGMKKVVLAGADPAALRAQMRKDKMITLQQDGLRLVAEGLTSLEELQRVFKPA